MSSSNFSNQSPGIATTVSARELSETEATQVPLPHEDLIDFYGSLYFLQEFDVIVIGGGINGLTTAAYLTKCGLKTVVVEKRHMVGTHCSTEEISIPGVRHNLHASALVTPRSPVIEDLELERYGLELIGPKWALFHPFQDGRAFLAHSFDPNITYKTIERFSKKDAQSFKKFINSTNKFADETTEYLFTAPSEAAGRKFAALMSKIPEIPSDFENMDGFDFANYMFENDQIKTAFVGMGTAILEPLEKSAGAAGVFTAITAGSGIESAFTARGGSYNLPYSLANCILTNGGFVLENCEAEKILIKDGEAYGVKLTESSSSLEKIIRAKRAIVSNLTAVPTFLHLVGEEHLDSRSVSALKNFDYSGQTLFTMVYVTNDIIRWSAAKQNPDALDTYWFQYGVESLNDMRNYLLQRNRGEITIPIVSVGGSFLFTVLDRTQAPSGLHGITTWINVPYSLKDGGDEGWDSVRREIGQKVTDRIDEYAPGFKRSIVAAVPYTPIDIVRRNPSAIQGNFAGGNIKAGQSYLDRPFLGCNPPRTPIGKLYISNSIHPYSGTDLAAGYIAACVVAEDLGVRKQPWWVHKPLGWFRKYVKRVTGREWDPYITVGS